jgi:anti-anti-sigma factor
MEASSWQQGTVMNIRATRSLTGMAVVAPTGELDISNEDRFRMTIQRLQQQVDHLVVDLTGLIFMGASGLRVLYEAWEEAQKRGTQITVVARAGGEVRHLLEISGLDKTLKVVGEAGRIAS